MTLRRFLILITFISSSPIQAQEVLEQLDQKLTLSAFDDQFRTRLPRYIQIPLQSFSIVKTNRSKASVSMRE